MSKSKKRIVLKDAHFEFEPWARESDGFSPQYEFLQSEAHYTCFVGGVGTGKSTVGGAWAVDMIFKYPKASGMICANNYGQLIGATLKQFYGFLDELSQQYGEKIYKVTQQNELVITLPGHEGQKIFLRSLDKGAGKIEGYDVAWIWLDEAEATPPDSFDVLTDRLREKVDKVTGETYGAKTSPAKIQELSKQGRFIRNQIKITTTPDKLGARWLYDLIHEPEKIEKREKSGIELNEIKARTLDNPTLAPETRAYYESKYTGALAKQQLEGEWVVISDGDGVYVEDFSPDHHVFEIEYDPKKKLIVSIDWGRANAACVFAQEGEPGQLIVLQEYFDRNILLKDFINNIQDIIAYRYPENITGFEAYCDVAGNRENEHTGETNIDVFHKMTGVMPTYKLWSIPVTIQMVRERLSGVAKDQRRKLLFNKDQTEILQEAFLGGYRWPENVKSLPVPRPKKDGYYDHLADALRYIIANKYSRTTDQVFGNRGGWKQPKNHNLIQYKSRY